MASSLRSARALIASLLPVGLAGAASFAACTGALGPVDPPSASTEGAQHAVPSGARRLTRAEYDATLRDLLGDTTSSGFALLPEDVSDPFDNDYRTQKVSAALVEAAETLATDAANRAVSDPAVLASILPCDPSGPDDAQCLGDFVHTFGRRALRRPLSDEEVAEFVEQFQPFAVEGGDFAIGVKLVIAALLQDVRFLYRIELGEPVEGYPGVFALDDYDVASRLSYFILGTTPPDWLLDRAEADELSSSDGVRSAALELLADARARDRVDRFHALWLGYHQLPHSAELIEAMRQESRALIERVIFEEGGDYFQIFRSEQTYLSDLLFEHYGYPLGEAGWVTYPDERRGILSHGSVLSSFGKFADTSPTQRGIFIRTRLFCQEIPKPPPDVDSDNPPQVLDAECKEDQYAVHNQGGCYDCHKLMDPIGFGLERYDNQGRYRETEEGKPQCTISGQGAIDGIGEFSGPAELAQLALDSGELSQCMVQQVYRFAMGRRIEPEDATLLRELQEGFDASGNAFDELILAIVTEDAYRFRKEEEAL